MATLIQNGIDFTINSELVGNLGSGKYSHASNLDGENNINADKISKKGSSFPSINCIDIDWNGARLSYVSLPNVLDNGNTINTTGQLLALINDLQEQINAIVYIMNNSNPGGGTVTPTPDDISTPAPTLPEIQFNKFPTDTSTRMPGIKIYTNNTDQSKLRENRELYDNAQKYRDNVIKETNITTELPTPIFTDALVIDDEIIDESDNTYNYRIDIYNDYIYLIQHKSNWRILTINHNGTTSALSTPAPTPTPTPTPTPPVPTHEYILYIYDYNNTDTQIGKPRRQSSPSFLISDITGIVKNQTGNVQVNQSSTDNIIYVTITRGYTGTIYIDRSVNNTTTTTIPPR